MSKNSLFCPKKESSITQKVLIEIFFNVIFHLMYMVWLDLDAKSALDTGTPSVEAHKCAVCCTTYRSDINMNNFRQIMPTPFVDELHYCSNNATL